MRILIADDFDSEIILLKEILAELDLANILIAYDGAEAIKLISENNVDVVITDYNMPFRNGGEVVDRALQLGVRKILLRSSHSVATLRAKLAELGISDTNGVNLICKRDFDRHELKIYIKDLLIG